MPNPHGIPIEQTKFVQNTRDQHGRPQNSFLGHVGFTKDQCRSAFLNTSNQTIECDCARCKNLSTKRVIVPGRHFILPEYSGTYSPPKHQKFRGNLSEITFRKNPKAVFSLTDSGLVSWDCANQFNYKCCCILCQYKFVEPGQSHPVVAADPNDIDSIDC